MKKESILLVEDQPQARLINNGVRTLSDIDVLSNIIEGGRSKELSRKVVESHSLVELSKMDYTQFRNLGLSHTKAVALISAFELRVRHEKESSNDNDNDIIRSSDDIYNLMSPELANLEHEEFWIVIMNRRNKVIKTERISVGGVSGTVIDKKIIAKKALDRLASGVICVHNHPSGNQYPSEADKNVTKIIAPGLRYLDINLIDHVIIAGDKFFSFADEGLML